MATDGRLAVFVGSVTSPNVDRLLTNFAALVPGDHHLLATTTEYRDAPYEVFGEDYPPGIRGSVGALTGYLDRQEPVALVQVTHPPIHGTVVGAVARRHDVPFVYRYSGDRFYEYRVARGRERAVAFALGSLLGRVPIRLADRHVALGPTGRRRLLARGVPSDSIEVLPPAVDADRFDGVAPVDLDVPGDRMVVMVVGRISNLKGAASLAAAIPDVVDRRPDLQFVLVGPRERRLDLPPAARDHVTYVDPVPPADVPGLLRAADVLVHPSLTEGVPRVVLEALAAGTPVLARDVGDVASVTDNTFETDAEFVERLAGFEGLPLDDISPFTVEALGPRYREFFGAFRE